MRRQRLAWVIGGLAVLAACGGQGGGSAENAKAPPVAARTKDSTGTVAASRAPAAGAGDRRTVLFVGTSLTAGLGLDPDSAYPALIQRKIDSAGLAYRVVNAGVSGETSAGARQRMGWLLRQPFDVLVLETGANDGLRGTPVSETRENIQAIVDTVRRVRPGARIVLVQMEALPNLGQRYTRAFHETFPLLARRNGLPLLAFLLDGVAAHPALVQGDGLHPNDAGEKIVAANVWRGLEPVLVGKRVGG
ncbi:MAG: arylesterase [Gemmatimonadota bacterium]|nr:arylesterase [Gemmatimonadota bacterium]